MAKKPSGFDNGSASENEYDVGYGKPPVEHRFKKGQSGNPRGRPRPLQPAKLIVAELRRTVSVNENGQSYKLTKLEAMVKQLVNRAILGDARAQKIIVAWLPYVEKEMAQDPGEVSDSFQEFVKVLDELAALKAARAHDK